MTVGSFRLPLRKCEDPDPAVFCPAEGYILPEDCPVPDPEIYCPANGYIPDEPGASNWELIFKTKTNSPDTTTFDSVFSVIDYVQAEFAVKIGDLIIYDYNISEVLDGTLQDVEIYILKGSTNKLFQISMREDHIVGNVRVPILGEAGNDINSIGVDFDNNPDIGNIYFEGFLSPIDNIWIRNTGFTGTLDLSGITKLATANSELALSDNPNLINVIFPSPANPVTGTLRFLSLNDTGCSGIVDLRAFTEIKNYATSKPAFRFYNTNIQYILFNESLDVEEFYLFYAYDADLTGVIDLSMITKWSTAYNGDLRLYNNPNLTGIIFPSIILAGGFRYINIYNCNLTGVLDLSMITTVYSSGATINCSNNPNLTGIILPLSPIIGKIQYLTSNNCDLQGTLDLTKIEDYHATAAYLSLHYNSNLTGVTFPSSITGKMASINISYCNLTGNIDLSKFLSYTDSATLSLRDNPNLTGFTLPVTDIEIKTLYAQNCDLQGTLDLSTCPNLSAIQLNTNPDLTGVTFASTLNNALSTLYLYDCNITGTLNLSNFEFSASTVIRIHNNSNLTGISFPSTTGKISNLYAYGCNLGYIDFTVIPNVLSLNNSFLSLYNNNMTAAEVNHILVDLANLVSGEGVGGDYTGRRIYMYGTNAAPDSSSGGYDGLTAKASLQSKGITVNTN